MVCTRSRMPHCGGEVGPSSSTLAGHEEVARPPYRVGLRLCHEAAATHAVPLHEAGHEPGTVHEGPLRVLAVCRRDIQQRDAELRHLDLMLGGPGVRARSER